MVSFYNTSVSNDQSVKLTQIDLKLNWTEKTIDIFVNNSFSDQCEFFTKDIENVNKLLIYNLYNSISYW